MDRKGLKKSWAGEESCLHFLLERHGWESCGSGTKAMEVDAIGFSGLEEEGRNCDHNYNDCLMHTCPIDYHCVDGINSITCIPTEITETTTWNSVINPTSVLPVFTNMEKSTYHAFQFSAIEGEDLSASLVEPLGHHDAPLAGPQQDRLAGWAVRDAIVKNYFKKDPPLNT
ncbi:UNVERIFIED_CONTAM: hypothetical protein FKN15_026607 [Acipenser sinensis]